MLPNSLKIVIKKKEKENGQINTPFFGQTV